MEKIAFEFNNEILLQFEHKDIVEKLLWHKEAGHTIVIASGGFDVYLQYYAAHYNIEKVVSTELLFVDGKFVEIKEECLGSIKINKLKNVISWEEYDWANSYSYSDSQTDLPLLYIVGNGYIVCNGQDVSWKKEEWQIIDVSKKILR